MSVSLKSSAQITPVDPVWDAVRANAQAILKEEPSLTSMVIDNVLNHDRFENALAHRLAVRLDHTDVSAGLIQHAFMDALDYFPELGNEARADLAATIERDPAAHRAIVPFLYFKGYQAIQTHRFAHALWRADARISRSTSRAARARCSRSTSTRLAASVGASCLITPPASSLARQQ